ncbi:restriction endonuclease subunit S [Roseicyclus amphidinii]|uniref:restriction endonuclease subunit S n=1 Tax=Roseicyclus amphidinii TaxID=3034232 RepID=UPI0024E15EB4|nr:restriction endonuclease subunit S [Roseicyclus sp. Amp-Y-6]
MEDLPSNWCLAELGEAVEILDSQRIPVNNKERDERLSNAKIRYPYYGATGKVGEIDDFIFEGDAVLLGEDGAPFFDPYKAKAYRVSGRYWVNNHAHILRGNGSLDNGFLSHQLNVIDYHRFVSGTTRLKLTQASMKGIPLKLPPLNEQRRIVEKIETLFARLDKGEEALRDVQKLLARYRQSVLKAAVTGQLTADWRAENAHRLEHGRDLLARILQTRRETWDGRGKYKEPTAPDTTDLPELPEGWVWATLPMLGEFGRGKSKHRPRNDKRLYSDGKYPFLQTGRVRNSAGRISEYDALYNDFGLAQSKIWPKGTICITIAANIAESGILEIDACFPDSVVGLVPHPEVSGEYVECFIRTAKENLDRYAPATAQKNINLEILNAVAVPLPPSAEQAEIKNRIDEAFSNIRFAEQVCQTELARSAALRQSILKDAFAGRLVPQDPTDEPAAALLARIAAQKSPTAKRGRAKAT